ncbi:PTS-dependent dihydroxyacetone kinase phosphotransferase subunit DhaM [Caproiciproducens galactitolivorans]|uniref:phosphoenolpyruvate--glycerone phosphotransferase n=1 Tax=Caproiciproducens galactitolivorans TaxID=642589 RepID=A0A4Z0YDJ9_9FIRM|nr:dihydroxyacetone kinase phosphoryl donor subunit DhaM [Caproiciproducens galactitolivorans]QEY35593.1 PTS-dependent dihydroxyacetone kinase phosphotransferase subunit DhaM [Caproiciproducens galactitolivorans]TGJ77321.1 PTS-dependent dihydroxyacetone kinase, phosphotransferase subunit DhaM [Caproiciproducens galactitolivorans]
MVGIVIVSHSEKLAQGVAELAGMMASEAPVAAAGGLDDGSLGTSFEKIVKAVDSVYSDDGVVILMDMGSAVMTAEMVIESMPDRKIKMIDCPLVEGAVVAAIASSSNESMEDIIQAAQESTSEKKL